jgi:hypothetical protein
MAAPVVIAAGRALLRRRIRRIMLAALPLVGVGVLAVVLLIAMVGGSGRQHASVGGACPGAVMEG